VSNFFGFGIGSSRTSIGGRIKWSGRAFTLIGLCLKAAYFELSVKVLEGSSEGGTSFFFLGIGLITAIGT